MHRRFIPLLLLGLACALAPVRADETRLSALTSYRRLTWDDYSVNDTAAGMSAQTHTFLGYSMQVKVTGRRGDYTAQVDRIRFTGGMDRANSWRRSNVPLPATQLLRHEQGHFTLNEIKLRQLHQVPLSRLPVGKGESSRDAYNDLQEQVREWYAAQLRDLSDTQHRYDRETVHGTRAREQNAWSSRVDEALSELPAPRS